MDSVQQGGCSDDEDTSRIVIIGAGGHGSALTMSR